jgi:hypothetical protein
MRRQPLIDGASDEAIGRFAGLAMPLRLRSPYDNFSGEVFEDCQAILRENHPDRAK